MVAVESSLVGHRADEVRQGIRSSYADIGHHTIIQIHNQLAVVNASVVFQHSKATKNLKTERILCFAKVNVKEAIIILALDNRSSMRH